MGMGMQQVHQMARMLLYGRIKQEQDMMVLFLRYETIIQIQVIQVLLIFLLMLFEREPRGYILMGKRNEIGSL
jgi:hypothetical protein